MAIIHMSIRPLEQPATWSLPILVGEPETEGPAPESILKIPLRS